MQRTPTIAIAGAGIGGLTAAILLARAGFHVLLLEREPAPSTAGAGIQITPNAGRILAGLGLDDAIAAAAAEPESIVVRSARGGQRIVAMPLGERFARGFGFPYRTVHRADLHGILLTAATAEAGVELRSDHEVVEYAEHGNGLTIVAETSHGDDEFQAAALIGADGIGSRIRGRIPDAAERTPTGRAAWRLVIPAAALPEGIAADQVGLWLGAAGHVVHYPVRRGAEFNIVAVVPDAGPGPGTIAAMRDRLGSWARPVRALVAVDGDWQRWPIGTVDPRGAWTTGRVALIGDAAHAMAPYLAQGGAMAIEDAAILSALLAADPGALAEAMAAYEAERRRRVARVWRAARTTADLYHMGTLTAAVRNFGMRFLGGRALLNRYAWIYRWDAAPEKGKRRPKAAPSSPDRPDEVRRDPAGWQRP